MRRASRGRATVLAVAGGLALGVCVGMLLLARQAANVGRSSLAVVDPESPYMAWLQEAGGAEDFKPANPIELPLGMYYPKLCADKPPCGCCAGESFEFDADPSVADPAADVVEKYKVTPDEAMLYKKVWNGFDGRRSGRIPTRLPTGELDTRPLAKIAKMLGSNPTQEDLQYTLGQVDPDGKGIDYPTFLLTMARHAPAWPVAISESLSVPMGSAGVSKAAPLIKKALSTAVGVPRQKVSIVRVRPAPGGAGSIIDFNIDASTDDMETMKKILTTENINRRMAELNLPQISKGPESVRAVEKFKLPMAASSITENQQEDMKAAIAGLMRGALAKDGLQGGNADDVSIVRIQGVNGRANEASVDIGIETPDENSFGVVKKALLPSAIKDAFVAAGLPAPSSSELVTLPSGFTPGCKRCNLPGDIVDGDDLGKDWVGNSPFDRPLSRYQAGEVHRFDSDKPICECDDDRR